jgi:DsbC/DsbD-like thiol-disulfide interchange protein
MINAGIAPVGVYLTRMKRSAFLLFIPVLASSAAAVHRKQAAPDRWDTATVNSSARSPRPVKWTVLGGDSAREVTSGRTVSITLQAEIAKGWHIYSLTQKAGGPIPLRLYVVGATDVVVRGVVKAPKPERILDQNFGIETELYSGTPRFTIPMGVAGRSPSGTRKFQIGARYQVCSDKMCLPPRTDKLDVAIRIASR